MFSCLTHPLFERNPRARKLHETHVRTHARARMQYAHKHTLHTYPLHDTRIFWHPTHTHTERHTDTGFPLTTIPHAQITVPTFTSTRPLHRQKKASRCMPQKPADAPPLPTLAPPSAVLAQWACSFSSPLVFGSPNIPSFLHRLAFPANVRHPWNGAERGGKAGTLAKQAGKQANQTKCKVVVYHSESQP